MLPTAIQPATPRQLAVEDIDGLSAAPSLRPCVI
jgi:hypothetical protein